MHVKGHNIFLEFNLSRSFLYKGGVGSFLFTRIPHGVNSVNLVLALRNSVVLV